jgi:hypothetical protein
MGGGNDSENIVALTAEEHYVAHQLLAKMYPTNPGLVSAAILMTGGSKGNKIYGWLRRRFSIALRESGKLKGRVVSAETRAKLSASRRGTKMSMTAVEKTAAANRGKKRGPLSDERKARISAAKTGKKQTAEQIERAAAPKRGRPLSEAHRQSLSAGKKGVPLSEQNKAALSAAQFRRWARTRAMAAALKSEAA